MSFFSSTWALVLGLAASFVTVSVATSSAAADPTVEASSQTPGDNDEARKAAAEFDRAVRFVDEGKYEEAVSAFERAYDLHPHVVVLFNLALAYEKLGRMLEAVATWEEYLHLGKGEMDEERRSLVLEKIATASQHLGRIVIDVEPAEAQVNVNSRPATEPEMGTWVKPGIVEVEFASEGYQARRMRLTVLRGRTEQIRIALVREGDLPPAPSTPVPQAPQQAKPTVEPSPWLDDAQGSSATTRRTWGMVLGGIGVVGASSAVALHFANNLRYERWSHEVRVADRTESYPADLESLERSIRQQDAVALGLGIGSGVALITGGVLFVSGLGSNGEVRAGLTPTSVQLMGAF